jgi:alpha-tubulin suppressor-like RCC1 family protein
VKCWGWNEYDNLGLGDRENRGDDADEMGDNLPAVDLGTGRTAKAISVGSTHTCAILDDGTVKCFGYNAWGHLGLGDTEGRGNSASDMGDNLPTVDLGTGRTAMTISAGNGRTCALLDDDSVKCWGRGIGDSANEMGNNLPVQKFGTCA